MGDLKYKVGDKVRVKSLDWYNNNKDEYGDVDCSPYMFIPIMSNYCGAILTIDIVDNFDKKYKMKEDGCRFNWADEMIEGIAENENNHLTETVVDIVRESNDRYRIVIDHRFDIEVDEGEYYAVRRRKEYPKTYAECVMLLGLGVLNELKHCDLSYIYKKDLIVSYQKLLICRDAYWKIYGKEIGLGKPWEPDWTSFEPKYIIYYESNGICFDDVMSTNTFLAFPTEEMRDAFKENFKELIEICNEFL